MLWRARDPKQYHVEYGYSCMGYEIAGALGDQDGRARPRGVRDGRRRLVPDDGQEIVTAVSEGIKLIIVLVQNHGFASIGVALARASARSASAPATGSATPRPGLLDGAKLPVDLAANAESLGADVLRVATIDELRTALAKARAADAHHRRARRDRPARPGPARPSRGGTCRSAEVADAGLHHRCPRRLRDAARPRSGSTSDVPPHEQQRRQADDDHRALDRRLVRRAGSSTAHARRCSTRPPGEQQARGRARRARPTSTRRSPRPRRPSARGARRR